MTTMSVPMLRAIVEMLVTALMINAECRDSQDCSTAGTGTTHRRPSPCFFDKPVIKGITTCRQKFNS